MTEAILLTLVLIMAVCLTALTCERLYHEVSRRAYRNGKRAGQESPTRHLTLTKKGDSNAPANSD